MRAIVIDDERLARKELITLLNQLETVEVVGEAVNVDDAKEKIDLLNPDVIFLDIQMPEKTGFQTRTPSQVCAPPGTVWRGCLIYLHRNKPSLS